jgi:hypothetical protein
MLFTGHLTAITFLYNDSDREISIPLRKHTQVSMVKKFSLWVVVFWELHSVETSQKQVFREKMS